MQSVAYPLAKIIDLWHWKSIGFQILLRTKYVPSLVKIHWRMLILECSQRCYMVTIWPGALNLWSWKSIGFQILLRTKYVPSFVKIHWRMLILECSQGCFRRMDRRTDGRTDGSITISLLNFVGERIMRQCVASINEEPQCINKWGDLLPPSTKSASMNEVICCLHQWWVHQ